MFKMTVQPSDTAPQQTVDIWDVGWLQPPPVPPGGPLSDFDMERLIQVAIDEDRNKVGEPAVQPGKVAEVQLSTRTRAAFSKDPTLLQQVTVAR